MLDTVADYIREARRLMQDERAPYRWQDDAFLSATNIGLIETRRLRPDFFIGKFGTIPGVIYVTDAVDYDPQYRMALLDFIAGYVGISDAESSQDSRAAGFWTSFQNALTGGK